MTHLTLPPGLECDILSWNGAIYLAFLVAPSGPLEVRAAPATDPAALLRPESVVFSDPECRTKAYPRLAAFADAVHVLYYRDLEPNGMVAVCRRIGGGGPTWAVPCAGNSPVAWGPGGLIGVQARDPLYRVLASTWPDMPVEGPLSRDGAPTGLSRFGQGRWITWAEDQAGESVDFQARVWTPDGTALVAVTAADAIVVELAGVRGILASGAAYMRPRVARDATGALWIAAHTVDGHGATGVHVFAHVTTADLTPVAPVPPPPDPAPALEGGVAYPAWPRKVWTAPYFEVTAREGYLTAAQRADPATELWPQLLGNAVLLLEPGDLALAPTDRARIVGPGAYDAAWLGLTVAYYLDGSDPDTLGARVAAMATQPVRPELAYLDVGDVTRAHAWPVDRPAWVTDRVWPAVQAYRQPGESFVTFVDRVSKVLARVAGYGVSCALVPGFYDRRHRPPGSSVEVRLTEDEMIGALDAYDAWMRSELPIVAFLPFAATRPGGLRDYPRLREACQRFMRANPLRPNRCDYWDAGDLRAALANKLGQSVALVALTDREKTYLRARL